MKNESRLSVMFGIAFVWFSTQFGGGFATGNQLRQYFVQYGWIGIITCIFAQCVMGYIFWYCLRYSKNHGVHNYRKYNESLFGRANVIFGNGFELVYLCSVTTGTAASFATTAATMESAFGVNYWISIVGMASFIFFVAIYGQSIIRKVATLLSTLIVVGLLIVYIPNIIKFSGDISANFAASVAQPCNFFGAMKSAFIYGMFQCGVLAVLCAQSKDLASPKEANKAIGIGIVVNSLFSVLPIIGLMAIVNEPTFYEEAIPLLILVNKGVAPNVLRCIISILIVLGSISTAVNLVSGLTNRICGTLDKNFDPSGKPTKAIIISTAIITIVCFGIAQFGLTAIVAKGYKYVGVLAIFVTFIPYTISIILTKCDTRPLPAWLRRKSKANETDVKFN